MKFTHIRNKVTNAANRTEHPYFTICRSHFFFFFTIFTFLRIYKIFFTLFTIFTRCRSEYFYLLLQLSSELLSA